MARVVVENIRVDFPIYAMQRNLRTVLFERATGGLIQHEGRNQDRVVVRALSDVSFALEDGDRLGLIGHNGSGKSTLLKVIAGIYEPIEGRLMIEGRVTPLFEMMPGLDLEDSGYENIVTAGLLFGMAREEIEHRIPEIEKFSELGEYLALPVRTYSAGMQMRLGFSLVTALDPDVLVMDEGIAAGDARFAERAEQRLKKFVGRSRIVVVASHSDQMISSLCNKAALMRAGEIVAIGPVENVLDEYRGAVHGDKVSSIIRAERLAETPIDQREARVLPTRLTETVVEALAETAIDQRKARALPAGVAETVVEALAETAIDQREARVLPAGAAETLVEAVWHRASFSADPKARHEWGAYGNEWAECVGGTVEALDGLVCERPEIHLPFRVCLRYRLLKDSPYKLVPAFHFDDKHGHKVLISYPSGLAPTRRGEYSACCIIEPFVLNTGRYTVTPALCSYELAGDPNHFSAPYALRFEVIERPGVDPRRHGWSGALPGTTRIRLEWELAELGQKEAVK